MLNLKVASWKRWEVSWPKIWKDSRKERHSGKGGLGPGARGQWPVWKQRSRDR